MEFTIFYVPYTEKCPSIQKQEQQKGYKTSVHQLT